MNARIRKWVVTSLLAVVAAAAVTYGVYYVWLTTPPAMPETLEQAVEVVNSPRFAQLSPQRKEAYQTRMMELFREADDTEREAVRDRVRDEPELRRGMRDTMREVMFNRVQAFATASPSERKKMLDEDIDRMQQMRRNRPPRPEGGERRGGGGGPRGDRSDDGSAENRQRDPDRPSRRERMQDRIEHGDPQRQALMMEYWRALRERMEERGIERPRRGG